MSIRSWFDALEILREEGEPMPENWPHGALEELVWE